MSESMTQEQVRKLMLGEHVPKQRASTKKLAAIVLEIPHPSSDCSPNSRGHWAKKHRAIKKLREAVASIAAYEIRKGNAAPPMWTRANVQATFHRPGSRSKRADSDNLIASLKGAMDGLQDAGIVANDSGLTHLPPQQVIGLEAQERKVVLTIVAT